MILKEFKRTSGTTYATVSYDEENNCIMDTWEGLFGTQENFQAVILFIADVIEEKKVTKWLADLRKMNGSFDGSKLWIVNNIMPRVIKAGLLYEAIVLPNNVFSKLSTKDTITRIHNFELRQFEDIEKAKAWLNENSPAMA